MKLAFMIELASPHCTQIFGRSAPVLLCQPAGIARNPVLLLDFFLDVCRFLRHRRIAEMSGPGLHA
jgi:hypothetical protein